MNAPLPNDLQKTAEADAQTAANALALIKSTPITTPELFTQAGEELKEIKGEIKRITGVRDEAVKPLQAVIATVKSWFAPALDRLNEAEQLRKSQIAGYLQAKADSDRKALEATRAAVLAGNEAEATAALATVMPEAPKVQGISTQTVWDFEIVDPSKIPLQFMQPNEVAIRAYVKAMKQEDAIPGVRAFPRTVIKAGSK